MFENLRSPRSIVNYNLMKGVTDWTNLKQFDYYEKGYPFLIVVDYPKWIREAYKYESTQVKDIIDTYLHVLEYEFTGLDGIENLTTSTAEISNGIRSISYINKVEQASSTFTMEFRDRAGMPLTKFHRYYLTGQRDPDTTAKTYHGLIDKLGYDVVQPGLDKEVFTFLYFTTDPTFSRVEAAHLLVCCQPTSAELSLSEHKKGEIEVPTIQLSFTGLCLQNDAIDAKAAAALSIMRNTNNNTASRLLVNSSRFEYSELSKMRADDTDNSYTLTSKGSNIGAASDGFHKNTVEYMANNGGESSISATDTSGQELKLSTVASTAAAVGTAAAVAGSVIGAIGNIGTVGG